MTSRVVIVTGATSGLGRTIALALIGAGHRVAAMGRSEAGMRETLDAAGAAGGADRILAAAGDVTSERDCAAVVAATLERFGALDGLVNNAGANVPAHLSARFYEVSVDDWRTVIDTNVNGAFLMARAVAPRLVERGWGRIVNQLTSYPTMLRAGYTPYGPSKAALEAATAAWAAELEGTGVTVNAILPGGASDTRRVPVADFPDRGRLISPAVMEAPIVWLLSDAADGITGRRFSANQWRPEAGVEANLAAAGVPAGGIWKAPARS